MNARILAIANHKGGVGKTAVTAGLGAALAAKGRKVLLVDMDPQANLTGAFGRGGVTNTLYESMRDGTLLPIRNVTDGLYGSIDIVPSSFGMSGIEREMATSIGHEFILQDLLEPVRGDMTTSS